MRPELPMLMLDYGAHPNVSGFCFLDILGWGLRTLPVGLSKKLIEKGAGYRGGFSRAVSSGRINAVNCMLDAKISRNQYQSTLTAAKNEGSKEIIEALKKRKGEARW